MASAAEQLAANISFANFSKATELKKRIWFTLGALVIFRLLSHVPMPGIDPRAMADLFNTQRGGVLEKISFVIEIKPSQSDEPGEEEKPPRRLEVEIRGVGETSVDIPPEAVRLFTEEVG